MAVETHAALEDLRRSHLDLVLAYNDSIEGWSRALDLRDRETEGHSVRVSEMTLDLARRKGLAESDLVHIRRGALLHDIGKMGVPDAILSKTGKLNEEEWAIMRNHPRYALDILSHIEYLRPALDIPLRHHEKWDGSGYPDGLVGTQIPLAARLFAIVDVWDALRSDRPYREAWSEEKALEYIRSEAGGHFDPELVDLFVGLVSESVPLTA